MLPQTIKELLNNKSIEILKKANTKNGLKFSDMKIYPDDLKELNDFGLIINTVTTIYLTDLGKKVIES